MNNPYTQPSARLHKLLKQQETHGKIVVGVDFDFTLFDSSKGYEQGSFYSDILALVLQLQASSHCTTCLWTASQQPFRAVELCNSVGLDFDYINESPLYPRSSARKPHFNVLLDDVAGLSETTKLLQVFLDITKDLP